jgi:manganese efflux pump family protein
MSYIFISIIFGLFIGLALSVDAFMLSFVFGVTIKSRREAFFTSILVGLFHFIMPIIGFFLTYLILNNIFSVTAFQNSFKSIGSYILILLGMMMLFKREEVDNRTKQNIFGILLFALSVSIDSFFIGIALTTNGKISILIVAFVFLMVSSIATYIPLRLIQKNKKLIRFKNLNIIAGIILILFAFISLILN